jgi:hypothetical protein
MSCTHHVQHQVRAQHLGVLQRVRPKHPADAQVQHRVHNVGVGGQGPHAVAGHETSEDVIVEPIAHPDAVVAVNRNLPHIGPLQG